MRIVNRQRPAEWPKRGWYWLLHHQFLLEWTNDIDERWQYIIAKKSEDEIDIRLSEIAPVLGIIPMEISEERAKCEKAWAQYMEARARYLAAEDKCNEARAKCNEAWNKYWEAEAKYRKVEWQAKHKPELKIMHKLECPGSRWDGETIFPEAKND